MDSAFTNHNSPLRDFDSSEDEEYSSSSSIPPLVNQPTWTNADEESLLSLRANRLSWDEISRHFTDGSPNLRDRTPAACRKKYSKISNNPRASWPWTVGEEQLLFSLRKAGYPAGKLSDEFPDRKYSSVAAKWRKMYTPTDYEIVHEWKHAEDLQLEESQREGSPWSSIGQLFPSHGAGECLIRFLELQGSLPYPCPSNSATLWEPEDILVLVSMRNNGKDWNEIASEIPKHDALDCRNYWYNNHWDAYRTWFKDGEIDKSRIARIHKNQAS